MIYWINHKLNKNKAYFIVLLMKAYYVSNEQFKYTAWKKKCSSKKF